MMMQYDKSKTLTLLQKKDGSQVLLTESEIDKLLEEKAPLRARPILKLDPVKFCIGTKATVHIRDTIIISFKIVRYVYERMGWFSDESRNNEI